MEKSIRILFKDRDLSQVKSYLVRQWTKILNGKVSIQDFIFAKEVRLGTYRLKLVLPDSTVREDSHLQLLLLLNSWYLKIPEQNLDTENEFLMLSCMARQTRNCTKWFSSHLISYHINATYYITKQILPALARVFNLVGADVREWFYSMPRSIRALVPTTKTVKNTIDDYYQSRNCIICGQSTFQKLCRDCTNDPQTSYFLLMSKKKHIEKLWNNQLEICMQCIGRRYFRTVFNARNAKIDCDSVDCPVLFERRKLNDLLQSTERSLNEVAQ